MKYAMPGRVIATVGLTGALALGMFGTASAAEGESVQAVENVAKTSVAPAVSASPPDCQDEFRSAAAGMGGGALAGGAVGGPPGALAGAAGGGIVGGTNLAQCLD